MAGPGRRQGVLLVVAGSVLWGTTGAVVRFVHDRTGLDGVSIGFYRLLVASVVLAGWQVRPVLRLWARVPGRTRWLLVSAGAGLGAYQALYFASVQNVGVSTATLVSLATAPVLLSCWASIRSRRLPGVVAATTLLGAVIGLVLVAGTGPLTADVAPHPRVGIVQAIGSGAGYAITTQWNRHLTPVAGAMTLTALSSAIGAVVLLPFAVVAGLRVALDPQVGAGLVYIGVMCTAAAYGLFFAGLRSVAADTAAVLTLSEPMTATVLAVALLGERLGLGGWIGALLLLASIAVLCLKPPRQALVPAL